MSLLNIPADVTVLLRMEQSQWQFHLTGSRYFGYAKPDSDWDFFVELCPQVEEDLVALGFRPESKNDYESTGVIEVWKHESAEIHLQIVEDARLKSAVQEAIKSSWLVCELHTMPKKDRKAIWNFAFDLFKAGRMHPTPRL